MPKVFIPQLPTRWDQATEKRVPSIDVNPAAAWGDLVVMFGPEFNRDAAMAQMPAQCLAVGPEDHILAVGDVALLTMALVNCVLINGSVRLLRWNNDSKSYRTEVIRA
jgi:hypothetical protein